MVRPLYIYDRRLSRQNCPAKQPHVFKSNVPFEFEMQSYLLTRNHVPIITLEEFRRHPQFTALQSTRYNYTITQFNLAIHNSRSSPNTGSSRVSSDVQYWDQAQGPACVPWTCE